MPFPSEHAARQNDPGKFAKFRRENGKFGNGIDVIWGVMDNGDTEVQSIRFDASKFTPDEAAAWCKKHGFKSGIEKATGEKAETTAANPDAIEIVETRPDGSGVVRVPILKAGQSIDLSLTSGGTKGSWNVTREHLAEMVANFKEFPGPVPIGVSPHRDFGERSGFAIAFLENLTLRKDDLLGDIWCMAPLFADVTAGHWRGFSGEFGQHMKLPTKKLKGWCVYGGVFTNRPATDSNFALKVAAEGMALDAARYPKRKEIAMPEPNEELSVRLATVEAEAKVSADKVMELEGKVKELKAENARLESAASTAEKIAHDAQASEQAAKLTAERKTTEAKDATEEVARLEASVKELKGKLQAKEDESLGAKVFALCRSAIREGVPPAKLAIMGDYEKDPLAWVRSLGSYENAEKFVKALPREAALSSVRSGHKPGQDDDSAAVPPTIAAELKRRGLDPTRATVRNTDELAALSAKK